MSFLNALFSNVLDNNLVFAQLIGMVSVFLVAQRPKQMLQWAALLAVSAFVGGFVGWLLYTELLVPWGVGYLAPLAYVLVVAAVLFVLFTIWSAAHKATLAQYDKYLTVVPLLVCNAVGLGAGLSNSVATEIADAGTAFGSALGSGLGVCLAVVIFSTVRNRIDARMLPTVLRGLPISLITAAIIALAFTGVSGIASGMFG